MGCILYELISKEKLFKTDINVAECARQHQFDGQGLDISRLTSVQWLDERRLKFLSATILEMLEIEPTQRPTAGQLYEKFTGWELEPPGTETTTASGNIPPTNTGPQSPNDNGNVSGAQPGSRLEYFSAYPNSVVGFDPRAPPQPPNGSRNVAMVAQVEPGSLLEYFSTYL
jgi:serine/threonine protein kinase